MGKYRCRLSLNCHRGIALEQDGTHQSISLARASRLVHLPHTLPLRHPALLLRGLHLQQHPDAKTSLARGAAPVRLRFSLIRDLHDYPSRRGEGKARRPTASSQLPAAAATAAGACALEYDLYLAGAHDAAGLFRRRFPSGRNRVRLHTFVCRRRLLGWPSGTYEVALLTPFQNC